MIRVAHRVHRVPRCWLSVWLSKAASNKNGLGPHGPEPLEFRILGEQAVEFEPTACCLRNALSPFRGVRSYLPAPENSNLATVLVRPRPGATVRVGVGVGVVLAERGTQDSGDIEQSSAV